MEWVTNNVHIVNGTVEEKRVEIENYFLATYRQYETLFDLLTSDAVFYERPQPLRHPLIFYFGHTAVFFVNKMILAGALENRINHHFESIFAIGVDEMSWDDLDDRHYDWPSMDEVRVYRKKVEETVLDYIRTVDFTMPITWENPLWVILMGIEHERIHLETSSVLIRQLDLQFVQNHEKFPRCEVVGDYPLNELITVQGGAVTLGKEKSHFYYGWDNEYGETECTITDFEASRYLVSNGEYLEFMLDGGYTTDQWWDEEGLAWRQYHSATMPEFWSQKDENYYLRTLTEEIALPLNWPAEVCYLEAKAFCNWKSEKLGKTVRMPDEFEYRQLLVTAGINREHGENAIGANWNLEQYASSVPVDQNQHGDFYDLVGNVWQWNETPIYGFNGFEVHPLYDDFSVPTFDNKHNLIKGGSWISTGNEIALHSRYAFRRHFYQHSGFRYVISERIVNKEFDVYETNEQVSMYCEFHYGDENFGVPNFSKAIAQKALSFKPSGKKALDIGASVGRASFEIAHAFESVDSLDFSARFVQVGAQMQKSGHLKYERVEEGELVSFQDRSLVDLGLTGTYDHINFMQQDASNMKPIFTGYDLVIAANLIDRLYDPAKFLRDISERLVSGGVLLIASPYTWLEDFTDKEKWLGGFKRDGEPVSTLDGLHAILDEQFEILAEPEDVPFVIRETRRKYQHTLSQVTVWKKK